jgi:hypothetical protein
MFTKKFGYHETKCFTEFFETLAGKLHQVSHSPCTLKKPNRKYYYTILKLRNTKFGLTSPIN